MADCSSAKDDFDVAMLSAPFRGVGRVELGGGGGSKQLKISPGGGFGKGCKISYTFLEGGGGSGQPGNPSGYTLALGGGPRKLL